MQQFYSYQSVCRRRYASCARYEACGPPAVKLNSSILCVLDRDIGYFVVVREELADVVSRPVIPEPHIYVRMRKVIR